MPHGVLRIGTADGEHTMGRLWFRAAGATRPALAWLTLLVAASSPTLAPATTLLDETRAVSTGIAPVERPLTVAQAGTLEVEVVDRQLPAALAALRVVVTRGDAIVGTPLTAAGRVSFDAVANAQYVVRVYGRPGNNQPSGVVGVRVTRAADPQPRTPVLEFVGLFEAPAAQNPLAYSNGGEGELLSFPEAGTYTVSFVDFELPAALAGGEAFIVLGANLAAPILAPSAPRAQAYTITVPSASVPGAAAQYRLFLAAGAATTARAGLFGLRIVGGPSNNVVYDRTIRVGSLAPGRSFDSPAAGDLTLQLRDGGFPAALSNLRAVLTAGGRRLGAPLVGAGSATVSAPAGPLTLWTFAGAGAQAGFLEATVRTAGGTTLAAEATAVPGTAANAPAVFVYPFDVSAPATYRARVTDFQFPSTLPGL